MEESLNLLLNKFKEDYELPEVDIHTYSPLTLAYMGDGIYELIIRTMLVRRGNVQAHKLHNRASALVKASAQAAMIEALMEDLTEEEADVYKRGRNAHSVTTAKNASKADYRKATGFEALMGYLYLQNDYERMLDLVKMGIDRITQKDE